MPGWKLPWWTSNPRKLPTLPPEPSWGISFFFLFSSSTCPFSVHILVAAPLPVFPWLVAYFGSGSPIYCRRSGKVAGSLCVNPFFRTRWAVWAGFSGLNCSGSGLRCYSLFPRILCCGKTVQTVRGIISWEVHCRGLFPVQRRGSHQRDLQFRFPSHHAHGEYGCSILILLSRFLEHDLEIGAAS